MERTHYCSRCLTTFVEDGDSCPNLACRSRRPQEGWGTLLNEGDTLDRTYTVDRRLAIGGAGVTYLGHELDDHGGPVGPPLAIKVLYAKRDQGAFLRRLANEAQILLELDHPNIVKIMGFVQRKGHSPYLVTQFEAGGSLLDHLRRHGKLPIRTVAGIGVQLCDALHVAHTAGVVHRDLKPENILLSEATAFDAVPRCRLTDFGIAKVFGGVGERLTRVGAFVGTPQYAAPEQFEGVAPTAATDVFAMAAVLRFCVTLRPHLPEVDMAHPEDTLRALQASLPALLDDPSEDAQRFNTFLDATLASQAGARVDLPTARSMLEAIAEGRDLLPRQRTAVPKLEPIEQDSSTFAFERDPQPEAVDTLEGILSQDENGAKPQAGTARHPQDPPFTPSQLQTGLTEFADPDEPIAEPDAAPADDAPPRTKRSGLGCVLALLVLMGGAALAGGGLVYTNPVAPSGPDQEALVQSILEQQDAIRAGCSGDDRVRVTLVVEPWGQVRSATPQISKESQRALALCLANNLKDLTFQRKGWQPATVSLEL